MILLIGFTCLYVLACRQDARWADHLPSGHVLPTGWPGAPYGCPAHEPSEPKCGERSAYRCSRQCLALSAPTGIGPPAGGVGSYQRSTLKPRLRGPLHLPWLADDSCSRVHPSLHDFHDFGWRAGSRQWQPCFQRDTRNICWKMDSEINLNV